MPDTSQGEPTAPVSEAPIARAAAALAPEASPPVAAEGRGCLYALSQPPLMIFLAVVGTLLLLAALHDLYLL
ncbi:MULTISPECIES: hypothetical protein [Streptomyces]|uniref:hypothetical protein n=1 Tax=Streptomyces TaxID=1883 RepID=UPI000F6FB74F|nr:hypothetical protein [Streptomyces sp. W1SF4]AZM88299.1 hypothetical protein D1J60_07185 [Streptomyces sp. W1SF4]